MAVHYLLDLTSNSVFFEYASKKRVKFDTNNFVSFLQPFHVHNFCKFSSALSKASKFSTKQLLNSHQHSDDTT